MLPPQLRHGLSVAQHRSLATRSTTSTLLRTTVAHANSRSFWGWRRGSDWYSQLDPIYHRFCRIRTLKTRAKLLKNLRRRGKFDWDFAQKPFFTPGPQYAQVRLASHWDGKGKHRAPWYLNVNEQPETEKDGKKEGAAEEDGKVSAAEEDGYELSQREKLWKERMEAMRKRIEHDPYEAIFGKRFEPFWSPLVPSWMREEMGLQGWPKAKETPKATADSLEKPMKQDRAEPAANETADGVSKITEELKKETGKESKAESQKPNTTQPSSYAYASSTSWDSWTNKTRRVEWDSVSRQTKKYEYDPITNRMVQIEAPKSPESKAMEPPAAQEQSTNSSPPAEPPTTSIPTETSESKPVNIPVKQSSDVRKSIPIPQPLSQPWLSSFPGFAAQTKTETSIGPVMSTAVSSAETTPKPSALAKVPEKNEEVDSLTADDVRAAMGKIKHRVHINTAYPILQKERKASSDQEQALSSSSTERDTRLANIFNERDSIGRIGRRTHVQNKNNSEWDQAELNVMLERELESLQRKKEKLVKDERGLFHIERQKRELGKLDDRIKEVTARVENLSLNSSAAAAAADLKIEAAEATSKLSSLQSSLDRMQSKELPKVVEPDDSAAHESTEPIEAFNAVPKNWAQQAELLQADRVRRTAGKRAYPYPIPSKSASRPNDDMEVMTPSILKAQLQKQAAIRQKQREKVEALEKLEKANAMLEAEVKEQKFRMQAHENRYAHKIRSLRQELETAYKQSAVHSGEHIDRIKWLEKELEKATTAAGEKSSTTAKIGKDIAEGDLHANVAKFGANEVAEIKKKALQRAEEKKKDAALVKEVKQIYEDRYGTIDANHRQPLPVPEPTKKVPKQVVEVESDVDLGEALAKYENEKQEVYQFRRDALENEIAASEAAAHEAQGRLSETPKLVDDNMPKLIPTELASKSAEEETEPTATTDSVEMNSTSPGIQWEEPPVYKVLAYDSGNDMMSTATTTSNFTGTETPISIPQALSQLYAPARFVPYFAELQSDGYQVIYGTKDLLVFRKVQGAVAAPEEVKGSETAVKPSLEDHGLAGWEEMLGKPNVEASKARSSNAVNPVDGTSRSSPPAVEPSTGNFASPTGFVNHDPVVPPEKMRADEYTEALAKHGIRPQAFTELESKQAFEEDEDEDIHWRHYPRVRREEHPHFTGLHRKWHLKHLEKHRRNLERDLRKMNNRRHRKSAWKWIIGAGLGTAGIMYVVGAAAEKAREGQQYRSEEDWAKKAQEARNRREGW